MLISPAAANSYFTCCESDREESVIQRILMTMAILLAMNLKMEMKHLGQEVEHKDNQFVYKGVQLILLKLF